jgi:soluble lytic murein transglycosylase
MMYKNAITFAALPLFFIAIVAIGCSAQPTAEQRSLESLREITKGGRLPAENVVADIERRFAGTKTGALARLLRARVRFENKDFRGAAIVLNSDEFEKLTNVADYALWLRGRALQSDGDHAGAMAVFEELLTRYPNTLRASNTRLLWAESAMAAGRSQEVPGFLSPLIEAKSADAFLAAAKAYEASGREADAIAHYRKAYIYGGVSDAGKAGEAKLTALGQSLDSADVEEARIRAQRLARMGTHSLAFGAFTRLIQNYPGEITPDDHLARIASAAKANEPANAQAAFDAIPLTMPGRDQAYRDLINAYAKARNWPRARSAADAMRREYPESPLTVKAWVEAGYAARDARVRGEETHFLRTALINYPAAVEVAGAQFELAWLEHEAKNHTRAADMLIEHLARYADKDSSNRGRAGYWSARNAELAGRISDACALYDALVYRYNANWYGHLGFERLSALRGRGQCQAEPNFPAGSLTPQAAANLRTITVAPETAGPAELERGEKSEQLSTIGLFDWAIEELQEAQRTAANSPKINLALAKHHRLKGNNVAALLALARSYPDYAQMFPEEMGRDEWDIFYPHIAWDHIARWSKARNLDIYKVAGLIRQESVFEPRARSSANAYGLMQLLLPTARQTARRFGVSAPLASHIELFEPGLNIELGTAYMREQLDRYGRIEYMAAAYNAGPGRVVTWRRTLPPEMDEWVEAIPFRETRGYVQGIIRNSAQYRRLYDENGNFKPNVGSRPVRTALDSLPQEQFAKEFPEVVPTKDGRGE